MNERLSFVSAVVLLGVSTSLGLAGRPVEMGLAVVAGALGLAFANLDRFRRFKGAGFEAEMWDKMAAVVEKETEDEPEHKAPTSPDEHPGWLDGGRRAVLSALGNSKYTWRYVSGVAKEANLPKAQAQDSLEELKNRGLARTSHGKKGRIWSLTQAGRAALANIEGASD